MRAIGLLLLAIFGMVHSHVIPVPVYPAESADVKVYVVGNPLPEESFDNNDTDEDEEWRNEQKFTEGAMGKRSIALGRSGFRPGKRSMENFHTIDVSDLIMKRSMAIGRVGLRPGKRSMAYGRQGFRPGKRSMAYGRQGFRPGKRSMAYGREGFRPGKRSGDEMESFQPSTPEIIVI
uniref:Uncharacterized protein n=1 Tax=Caenorhabditis japonica TaxID=281687 RepID=A0A8R1I7K1_CAEJA